MIETDTHILALLYISIIFIYTAKLFVYVTACMINNNAREILY